MSPAGLGVKVIQGIGYISDILNAAISAALYAPDQLAP
jgi:hypothetical protein